MANERGGANVRASEQMESPWVVALNRLREWDPDWAEHCVKVTTKPWTSGSLPVKFVELIMVGLSASQINPNPDALRRHIRAALAANASLPEVLFVLKVASVMCIHSSSFNAPLLLQEASMGALEDFATVRRKCLEKAGRETPAVKTMKAIGHWSEEWESILFFDPVWTNEYMAMCTAMYAENVLSPKEVELLLIALDAAYVHIYARETRCHIRQAFKAGATVDEIIEVLKLVVVQGIQACNLGVTILAEELDREGT